LPLRKVDPDKLIELRKKGVPNKEIAKVFGVTIAPIFYWVKKLNLPRRSVKDSAKKYWAKYRIGVRDELYEYLKNTGPVSQRRVLHDLKWGEEKLRVVTKKFSNLFLRFKLTMGTRRGGAKYSAPKLIKDLSMRRCGHVVSLKNDDRLDDFIISYINTENLYRGKLCALHHLLKNALGKERAQQIMSKIRTKKLLKKEV